MLIGIHAPMHGGKTTVANFIKQHISAEVRPFAGPLKRIAITMGWNGQKDEKGRRLLQLLGTQCGRECIRDDIWTQLWLDEAQKLGGHIIADDVRFPDEAEAIIARGGMVLRVVGRETPLTLMQRIKRWLGLSYCHRSEIPLPPELTTHTINNTGSIMDLAAEVGRFCEHL
jgi:hypothetical protein